MWRRPSSAAAVPQLLVGKSMAITGGVTGIGRAIVVGYLTNGANVAVNHLGDPKSSEQFQSLLEEASQSLGGKEAAQKRLIEVPGDVGDPETGKKLVAAAVSKWGRLDVFISNAGICEFREFLEITPDLWNKTVNTNLTGAYNTIHAAATQLSAQSPPGGSIIGISSISALVGGAQQGHYTPTKAGVLSLIQSTACALGKYNIRCNALLPGTIKTQLNEKDLEDEEKRKYMEGRIPLGRTGVPSDLAGPAVFLGNSHIHLWPDPTTSSTKHTSYAWMQPNTALAKQHEVEEYLAIAKPQPSGFVYVETDRYLPSPTPAISENDSESEVRSKVETWAKEPLAEVKFLKSVLEDNKGGKGDLMRGVVLYAPFHIPPAQFTTYLSLAEDTAGPDLWSRVVGFRLLLQGKNESAVAALVSSKNWIANILALGTGRAGQGWSFDVGVDVHRDGEGGLEEVVKMVREVRRREEEGQQSNDKAPLQTLSSDENTFMKLSGAFNEFSPNATPADVPSMLASLRPVLDIVFANFAGRIMFGSDWPVCNVGGPRGEAGNWGFWREVVDGVLDERALGGEERDGVWWGAAERAYGITM
ncbi:hypothetical protein FB567DRAFT_444454 [Paraphoma chrysanthemicola]|uniref:Amidohydrolase-related domain-containing protein n=1 Tax=Paraphoma chrysanthemicola TaxID=798071 RepID=A0A8K0R6R8_9PLEO|nr:hypothetical protein FB567DRAFT_444454 [Paraphoma chrysanthemicola]